MSNRSMPRGRLPRPWPASEEGEGLSVGQLPYARANDPERLWPLLTEKNGESIIKQIDPYDNAYRIFKGTLK